VFKSHVVGSASEPDATSGVGIGLTNSKILARSAGGTISLKSEEHKFTEVTFTFESTEVARSAPKPEEEEKKPDDLFVVEVSNATSQHLHLLLL